jgi:uncharacterized coiled-coil DUF342 family protein
MEQLRETLKQYLENNEKLSVANSNVAELRTNRTELEKKLEDTYTNNPTLTPNITFTNNNLTFKAIAPNTTEPRYKAWTLSKKDLEKYLTELLPNGTEVFQQIEERHKPTLAITNYTFELKEYKRK